MPIYIYRCENCGVQFERHQSFTEEPLKRCPECSKNSLRKVLTPAGIVFKGSGWYATDHKSASGAPRMTKNEGKESNSSEKSESTSSSSGSSGSSEGSSSTPKSESGGSNSNGNNNTNNSKPAPKSESSSKASE
ncbi:MAG: zinc ribbon domain-containing protein [Chloroflexota bacterium]